MQVRDRFDPLASRIHVHERGRPLRQKLHVGSHQMPTRGRILLADSLLQLIIQLMLQCIVECVSYHESLGLLAKRDSFLFARSL